MENETVVENGVQVDVIIDDNEIISVGEKNQDNVVRMIHEDSEKKFYNVEDEPVIVEDQKLVNNTEQEEKNNPEEEKNNPEEEIKNNIAATETVTETVTNGPRKAPMSTSIDVNTIRDAYEDVRADNSEIHWAVFKFEGPRIVCSSKGIDFEEFRQQFSENERAFGYIRIQTGDEMSKRQKFLFLTWVGPGVSVLQRAKMSTDKAVIKNIISNFAVELQLESLSEFDLEFFIDSLNKASGANYGTGIREI